LAVQAAFFVEKIREKRSTGPYRLAAYCASSVMAVAVVKLLEESGQKVLQLAFIDHFPLLWANEATELLLREQYISTVVDSTVTYIMDLLRQDPLIDPHSERIGQYQAVLLGSPHATRSAIEKVATARRQTASLLQFLMTLYPDNILRSPSDFTASLIHWASSVRAPLSLLIAEFGMITTVPGASHGAWADLGAHLCRKPAKQHFVTGVGHSGILADKRTADFLQEF
jgi:hypothetical protein